MSIQLSCLLHPNGESARCIMCFICIVRDGKLSVYVIRLLCFRADLNGDSMLTIQELARYINRRIREHIEASIRNNPFNFSDIDRAPRNGLVTWDEYYAHFLRSHSFTDKAVKEAKWGGKVNLDRNTKDLLARDRALWNEAARTDSFSLTLDEFLAFQHPGMLCT